MNWVKQLRAIPPAKPSPEDEESHFLNLLKQSNEVDIQKNPSTKQIPRFYIKKKNQSPLSLAYSTQLRISTIQKHRNNFPSRDELDLLWDYFSERATLGDIGDKRISYHQFLVGKQAAPESLKDYLTVDVFMRFGQDDIGRISLRDYFSYLDRKTSLIEARMEFAMFDEDQDGYLTEAVTTCLNYLDADLLISVDLQELSSYLESQIPQLHLTVDRPSHYLCTATRKFCFFLDPSRRDKISIESIVLSPILDEFFELREELSPEAASVNWFSGRNCDLMYLKFLNLDFDQNGMLSRSELSRYGTLTTQFLDRVFQEYQTYEGNLDYKGFLDFVLAMENTDTPESIAYCFRLLDINGTGYIDDFVIKYFFDAVVQKGVQNAREMEMEYAREHGIANTEEYSPSIFDMILVSDVANEIFDMANPEISRQISLTDLLSCGVGGTIVSILSDYNAFETYENRENVPQKSDG